MGNANSFMNDFDSADGHHMHTEIEVPTKG